MKKAKCAAVIFAFVLFFAMILSALFIAHETDHHCTGENCSVCMKIDVCENALKNISAAVTVSAVVAAVCLVFVRTFAGAAVLCVSPTPVSLKVKLSD